MQSHRSCVTLNRIPLTSWVLGTVDRMNRAGATDRREWNHFWFETYKELGGHSGATGAKVCPRTAAYGLWFLGRLVRGGRPLQKWPVQRVDGELGKNAAYAVIAADLLVSGTNQSPRELWLSVQAHYIQRTRRNPAATEQGGVKVAVILFCEQQIV